MGQFINSKKYGYNVQLYKHANGDVTYYARYNSSELDSKGRVKPVRVKIGKKSEGITEQYVKAKCDEFTTAQRLGEVPEPIKRRRKKEVLTLQQIADVYFEYRGLSSHNSHNIEKNINNDKSVFKNHLSELANQDVTLLSSETDVIDKHR